MLFQDEEQSQNLIIQRKKGYYQNQAKKQCVQSCNYKFEKCQNEESLTQSVNDSLDINEEKYDLKLQNIPQELRMGVQQRISFLQPDENQQFSDNNISQKFENDIQQINESNIKQKRLYTEGDQINDNIEMQNNIQKIYYGDKKKSKKKKQQAQSQFITQKFNKPSAKELNINQPLSKQQILMDLKKKELQQFYDYQLNKKNQSKLKNVQAKHQSKPTLSGLSKNIKTFVDDKAKKLKTKKFQQTNQQKLNSHKMVNQQNKLSTQTGKSQNQYQFNQFNFQCYNNGIQQQINQNAHSGSQSNVINNQTIQNMYNTFQLSSLSKFMQPKTDKIYGSIVDKNKSQSDHNKIYQSELKLKNQNQNIYGNQIQSNINKSKKKVLKSNMGTLKTEPNLASKLLKGSIKYEFK